MMPVCLGGHAAAGDHFQAGRTDDAGSFASEIGVGLATGIGCDDGLSAEMLDDKGENLLTAWYAIRVGECSPCNSHGCFMSRLR